MADMHSFLANLKAKQATSPERGLAETQPDQASAQPAQPPADSLVEAVDQVVEQTRKPFRIGALPVKAKPIESTTQIATIPAEPAIVAQVPAKPKPPAKFAFATQRKLPVEQPIIESTARDVTVIESTDVMSLADLSSIDVGQVEESRSRGPSQYADETPADKPTRELPEGLTKEQLSFIDLIDGVYNLIDDPELLGAVIRNIMVELKSFPQYMTLIAKEDVRTWVMAMRNSMGLARIKKQEKATTRKTGSSKSGPQKQLDTDLMSEFKAMMGESE